MWKSADGTKEDAGEAGAAAPGTPKEANESSSKGGGLFGKKLIVILVAGLVLAGGGIGAAKMLGGGGNAEEKPEEKKVVAPLTWEFPDLVVNIRGKQSTRVLRCVLHVEVENAKALDELELRDLVFRDEILSILRSKTLEDLEYPGDEALKRQIRDRLNRMMISGSLVDVYFKEFLIH
jgi:flagellar FliL protein